jgi:predicted RNA-binding protein Jag
MGILIGRGGATLEALQELVRAGVQRRLKTRQALVVDVEAYWERRRSARRRNGEERGGRRQRGERRGGGGRQGSGDR